MNLTKYLVSSVNEFHPLLFNANFIEVNSQSSQFLKVGDFGHIDFRTGIFRYHGNIIDRDGGGRHGFPAYEFREQRSVSNDMNIDLKEGIDFQLDATASSELPTVSANVGYTIEKNKAFHLHTNGGVREESIGSEDHWLKLADYMEKFGEYFRCHPEFTLGVYAQHYPVVTKVLRFKSFRVVAAIQNSSKLAATFNLSPPTIINVNAQTSSHFNKSGFRIMVLQKEASEDFLYPVLYELRRLPIKGMGQQKPGEAMETVTLKTKTYLRLVKVLGLNVRRADQRGTWQPDAVNINGIAMMPPETTVRPNTIYPEGYFSDDADANDENESHNENDDNETDEDEDEEEDSGDATDDEEPLNEHLNAAFFHD